MTIVAAASAGQTLPVINKFAGQQLRVMLDFSAIMKPFELPVKVISLNPGGALIEQNRVNSDCCVQLDIGIDTIPGGQPYIDRNITMVVQTTQGTVYGAFAVRVYP